MANKTPIKANFTGSDVTSLGEFASGDTIDVSFIADGTITAAKLAADTATQAELDTVSGVASAALPKAGGAMTGAITTNSTFDGRDVGADGTKLDGIAASANAYVHPNHSGDVVSAADGAMTIQTDAVDIAMLSATGTASSSTFLRGDNSWQTAGASTLAAMTDATVSSSAPGDDENPSAVGHLWVHSAGATYVCTDATTDANIWLNTNASIVSAVEYLVIAGGGSGGFDSSGNCGGGGAGGYRYDASHAVSGGTSYTVTVGAGGTAPTTAHTAGDDGDNSVFGSITSTGGGGGGAYNNISGRTGGSGGGSGQTGSSGGAGTSGQGNAGGSQNGIGASGGGGAGAAGSAPTQSSQRAGGAGGAGTASSITGSSVTRGGGGGGHSHSSASGTSNGLGGAGGGGNGGHGSNDSDGTDGAANTGGGGGGGGETDYAGDGGSGVVIIAYSTDYNAATVGGSPTYSYSNGVTRSGYHLYIFTAGTGTITF